MPRKGGISDKKLLAIANEIGNGHQTVQLAVNLDLGATAAQSLDLISYKILCTARDATSPENQLKKLRDGLINSGYTAQADKHLPMRKRSASKTGDVANSQKKKIKSDPAIEHKPPPIQLTPPPIQHPPSKKQKGKSNLKEEESRLKKEEKELKALKKQAEELNKEIEQKGKGIEKIKKSIESLMEKQIKDSERKLEKQRQQFDKIKSSGSTSKDSAITSKS